MACVCPHTISPIPYTDDIEVTSRCNSNKHKHSLQEIDIKYIYKDVVKYLQNQLHIKYEDMAASLTKEVLIGAL